MINNKQYIKLIFDNNDDYNIYVISKDKKIKLSKQNKLIMSKVIKKFPYEKITDNTIIYPNLIRIMLAFYNEKSKIKKKKVNRKKSKNIITTILLITTLSLGIKLIHNHFETSKDSEPSNTIETQINNTPKIGDNIDDLEDIQNLNTSLNITNEENFSEEESFTSENTESTYENTFNYEYQDIGDKEALNNASTYMDTFKKYERIYGIDAKLLCAIGAQESSGIHKDYSVNGFSTGIMGIENIWDGGTINVFNFETNNYETITVDYSKIGNLDYNVKIGAAIFQECFYNTIKNNSDTIDKSEQLAFTIQKYNMGPGNMNKILNLGGNWINNREIVNAGDKNYFEHVLSRLDNNTSINIRLDDGSYHITDIINNALENTYSRM